MGKILIIFDLVVIFVVFLFIFGGLIFNASLPEKSKWNKED